MLLQLEFWWQASMTEPRWATGGRAALAGFLYEMVGLAGLKAQAQLPVDPTVSGELKALLKFVRDAEAQHEQFGQDSLLTKYGLDQTFERVLVQFKYSQTPSTRKLGVREIKEIASTFAKSMDAATKSGATIDRVILISNRPRTPSSVNLMSNPRTSPHAVGLNEVERQILGSMCYCKRDPDDWIIGLRRFASDFGVTDAEFDDGVVSIIGEILNKTATGGVAFVRVRDLVKAFTGFTNTRPLKHIDVVPRTRRQAHQFVTQRIGQYGPAVRRALLDEISAAAAQHALVVIHGSGGTGKTVVLAQWASQLTKSEPAREGAFMDLASAGELADNWIVDLVANWRNLPPDPFYRTDNIELSIRRLALANPELSPPLLHLGLDGLDENVKNNHESAVRTLVRTAWYEERECSGVRPPNLCLVVTCRDAGDVIGNWLGQNLSGFPYKGETPCIVTVGDFSDAELLEAFVALMPYEYDRIRRSLLEPTGSEADDMAVPAIFGSAESSSPSVVDREFLESLRHPVMWGAFENVSGDARLEALSGQTTAQNQVARSFAERFCIKAIARGTAADMAVGELLTSLSAVAHATWNSGDKQHRFAHWADAARANGDITMSEARRVYHEAISAGVIIEDAVNHWRWRHQFVWGYLANLDV